MRALGTLPFLLALPCLVGANKCLNGGFWMSGLNRCLCPHHLYGAWCQFSCHAGLPRQTAYLDEEHRTRTAFSHCECLPGWGGYSCNQRIHPHPDDDSVNPADYRQCHGNGTWDAYKAICECRPHRFGKFCQFSCNEGRPTYHINVTNHRLMFSDANGVFCHCNVGWKGDRCEERDAEQIDPRQLRPHRPAQAPPAATLDIPSLPARASTPKQSTELGMTAARASNSSSSKALYISLAVVFVGGCILALALRCLWKRRKAAQPQEQAHNVFTLHCIQERERVSQPSSSASSPSSSEVPLDSPFRVPSAARTFQKHLEAERAWTAAAAPPPTYSEAAKSPTPRLLPLDDTTGL